MFQTEQISILIVTAVLAFAFWYISKELKSLRNDETPNRLTAGAISYVQWINNYTINTMGEYYGPKFSAYLGSVFIYLLVSNISGLVGLSAPTANFSVTLVFAVITWLSIQGVKLKENGVKGYFQSLLEPFSFFLIPNIFSELAPLISLPLRIFGNVIAGSVIMSLLYTFTGWLSDFVPLIGNFNFIGVIVAPALHLYFDLFSGFLQAFLFISLSLILIGVEVPQEKL
jgi:F-type H+-transporting ATPase subunit a